MKRLVRILLTAALVYASAIGWQFAMHGRASTDPTWYLFAVPVALIAGALIDWAERKLGGAS